MGSTIKRRKWRFDKAYWKVVRKNNKTTSCGFLTKFIPFNKPVTHRNTASCQLSAVGPCVPATWKSEKKFRAWPYDHSLDMDGNKLGAS